MSRSLSARAVRSLFLASLAVLAMASSGCAANARFMSQLTPPRQLATTPDSALVVFVRPSSMAFAILVRIVDEEGHFLGDLGSSSYFAVRLAPGRHTFYAWSENTEAMQADVVAGKTYYVQVRMRMGAFSARTHIQVLSPRRSDWAHAQEWLLASHQMLPDTAAGQADVARRGDVNERIRRGSERFPQYSGEEREHHTMLADDGV